MTDQTRRIDSTGYEVQRDPRLNPQPRVSARPAPQGMALPQADDAAYYADHEPMAVQPRPPAASVPEVPAQPEEGLIPLSRPYMVHGEPLKQFKMRKPVAREIGKIGNPLRVDLDSDGTILEIEPRLDRVMKYITALSDPQIPPSVVEQFDYVDLDTCAAFLGPFFLRMTS